MTREKADLPPSAELFHKASWIWDDGDPFSYHRYLRARKAFRLAGGEMGKIAKGAEACLVLTADAMYQAFVNGQVVGHGPAKSAEGRRSVDSYDIARLLRVGDNELDVLVLSLGVGTYTYCIGKAGLIFEIRVADRTYASDSSTLVQQEQQRQRRTARRWYLPCLEDVDATAQQDSGWRHAAVVRRGVQLYARRAPLPAREPLFPRAIVAADRVKLPNFSVSLRARPYLTEGAEQKKSNRDAKPAFIVTDVVSPIAQELRLTPTLGNVGWFIEGRKFVDGSGWSLWDTARARSRIRLKKGSNRLVGLLYPTGFEDLSIAGHTRRPVKCKNPFGKGCFQVIPAESLPPRTQEHLDPVDWSALRDRMPRMDPAHTMIEGNAHDLAVGAEFQTGSDAALSRLLAKSASAPLELPAASHDHAVRVIVDLGVVRNGWLAFEANGRRGNRLIFSFAEAIETGPPLRVQWPSGCNNALTYRLRDGHQTFESFLPYGVRYIAIHHTGKHPVQLANLRILTANCGSRPIGFLNSSDGLLNRVYQIATQAVIAATDDTLTDCPTFEQANYNFDNRTAAIGDAFTCANHAVTRNSITVFAEDPRFRGLVRCAYPSSWEKTIPLWSFHWILWCKDYYEFTGDTGFVRRMMPRIAAGIEEGLQRIGSRDLLEWAGVWHFVEWGRGRDDDHEINTAEQAGFVAALNAAESLVRVMGGRHAVRLPAWRLVRLKLIHAANRLLWDPARRAYADSLHADGSLSPVSSQATNAMAVICGVADKQQARSIVTRILQDDPGLLRCGSPYGLYYVLEVLDQFGEVERIFEIIRHRWGDMVRAGDTTTWETFAEYGHGGFPTRSRCHPFSAYVVKYLVKYLLGLEPLRPGFATFRVCPQPPRSVASCEGAVPTPAGLIRIGWQRTGRTFRVNVEHPPQLKHLKQ